MSSDTLVTIAEAVPDGTASPRAVPRRRLGQWTAAAVVLALIGLALGLLLVAAELYYAIEISRRDLVGIDIGYSYPFATALALAPVILGAAFLAALGPAESAVRGSLVEALEYE